MLETTKKANGWLIGLVLVAYIALSIWINLYGFRKGLLNVWLFSGLINATLIANLLLLAVVVVVLLFGLGRLRPRDIGLYRQQVVPALLGGIVIWVLLQLAAFVVGSLSGSLHISTFWHNKGDEVEAGRLISQLFGNALCEEIVFRGFLFVQLLLHFNRWFLRKRTSFIVALILSQAIFALMHLPNRIWVDDMTLPSALMDAVPVFIFGLLIALIYWRTRNLLLAVVIHALINEPMAVIATSDVVLGCTMLLLIVGLMLLWPRFWVQSQLVNS